MATTAIPIVNVAAYQDGTTPTLVAGVVSPDDLALSVEQSPKLHLIVVTGVAECTYDVVIPAGISSYGETITKTVVQPANTLRATVVDLPSDLRGANNAIQIISTDADMATTEFYAFTWQDTPRAGDNTGYRG